MDAVSGDATVLVFLIDDEHLGGACASRAAYFATRKSVTGKVLVIPLLAQADTAFENSPLNFMSPVTAYGAHLDDALITLSLIHI